VSGFVGLEGTPGLLRGWWFRYGERALRVPPGGELGEEAALIILLLVVLLVSGPVVPGVADMGLLLPPPTFPLLEEMARSRGGWRACAPALRASRVRASWCACVYHTSGMGGPLRVTRLHSVAFVATLWQAEARDAPSLPAATPVRLLPALRRRQQAAVPHVGRGEAPL